MQVDAELDKEKIIIERDGKKIECNVLFTFDCEETLKSYVGYTDHSVSEDGRKNIFVSSYDPLKPGFILEDITDPMELEMVNDVLESIDEESQKI